MVVKEKAEALVQVIAKEKAMAERKLDAAKPALEEAEAALNTIKPAHIGTYKQSDLNHIREFLFHQLLQL